MSTVPRLVARAFNLPESTLLLPVFALALNAFAVISFFVFVNATNAFLLFTTYRVPGREQGSVIGKIGLADELTSIVALGLWGAVSDRFGRRVVLICGYVFAALGLFLIPLGTDWAKHLVPFRMIFAFGSSALTSMMAAMIGDIIAGKGTENPDPKHESNTRLSSLMGISSGLGALTAAFGYLRLGGYTCLKTAYFTVGGICVFLGLIVVITYKGVGHIPTDSLISSLKGLVTAFSPRTYKKDPDVTLAVVSGFAARTASITTAVFISLWISRYYTAYSPECPRSRGGPLPNATVSWCGIPETRCVPAVNRASNIGGTTDAMVMVFALLSAIILERVIRNPRVGVVFAAFVGIIGFAIPAGTPNPIENIAFLSAATMGIAQITMILASQILLISTMERHPAMKGALSGAYSLFGGIGVIFASLVGGELSDQGHWTGPFSMVSIVFAVIAAFGLWIIFWRGKARETTSGLEEPEVQDDTKIIAAEA